MAKPDEGDASQPVKFSVANTAPPPPKWGLIALVIVLVLIVGGVLGWLLLRKKTPSGTVPNIVGMTVPDATTALTAANLKLDSTISSVVGTAADSGKIVSQIPAAGAAIGSSNTVQVKVGAEMVNVPLIIGHPVAEAQQLLAAQHLTIGQSTVQANANFAGGVITDQTPAANMSVQNNSTVNVTVTPQTVTVPQLVGMPLGSANSALISSGLVLGSLTGNLTGQNVISQSPAANTQVAIGTKVNLQVPSSVICQPVANCYYTGNSARIIAQHW